jgi:hypothetical protein
MRATKFSEWSKTEFENMRKITTRDVQIFLVDLSLTSAGLILISLGIHAVWKENLGLAGTALTAGLVLLFSATIHRFELLKGLGIEAKTRALNQTLDKAEVTLAQMKKLSEMVGTTVIEFNSSIGRTQRIPPLMETYRLSREVKELLKEMGSDQVTIQLALAPWARSASNDLFFYVKSLIDHEFYILQNSLRGRGNLDNPDETQRALNKRAFVLEDYRTIYNNPLQKDIKLLAQSLRSYAAGSPENLSVDSAKKIQAEIDIAENEFRSLADTADFLNIDYWTKVEKAKGT